ncbi:MAG: hypothetical protein RJA20_1998 [Bacteroidota bacterium]|jgi:fatty-acyl-CoA synthase
MMEVWQQDWAAKWAVYSPEKIAIREHERDRTLTYGQLNRLANRLVRYLRSEYQLVKGDRVAVLAEFSLEYIIAFSAAQKAGIILVPLNYRLATAEIEYLIKDSAPALLIAEDKFTGILPEVSEPVVSTEYLEELLDPASHLPEDARVELAQVQEDDPLFILYTSGTTGFPKGALYTHKMLFWNSINTAVSLVVNTESRTINVMPPFHTGGWNVLITPFLHHGAYICLLKKFDPGTALELLQSERCTIFMGVPTILQMIARDPDFEKARFPDLIYLIVGGEPMPIPLIELWHAKKVPVRQGYGMTEVGPNLTSLHQNDAIRKKGSIGRPNFYVQIRIVDEKGQDQPPGGAPGELWLRGPMVMPGYWNNPEASAAAFSDDRQWFRTGDELCQDEEGYLFVVDRIKNMYKSGGENVYPAEIERVLIQFPGVAEVAVTGVPDEKWGEAGKAFVVMQQGVAFDPQAMTDYCRQRLARFKIPKYFKSIESLPKTDSGKINRNQLKKS